MAERTAAVLILGLQSKENEIEIVHSFGYQALLLSSHISMADAFRVDVPIEMNLNDEERTIAEAVTLGERFDVRAVYTLNEYRVPLAARAAEALGLSHGLPYEAALNCRQKKRTRRLLAQYGIASPRFATVRTPTEVFSATKNLGLPIVVKPSNESGSRLVTCCNTLEEVYEAVEKIRRSSLNWVGEEIDPEILLEEYVEGSEFSVEACTAARQTNVLAITAKHITPPPRAVEVGHTVPAGLSEIDAAAICSLVVDTLSILGVNNIVTHTEVRLTTLGPKIIEVNARPAGDKIPLLVRAVTGYDLREVALHLALGETLANAPHHPIEAHSAAVRFLIGEREGRIKMPNSESIAGLPGVQSVKLEARNGTLVTPTTNNYNRLGYFIAHGTNVQGADLVAENVLKHIDLRIYDPSAESC